MGLFETGSNFFDPEHSVTRFLDQKVPVSVTQLFFNFHFSTEKSIFATLTSFVCCQELVEAFEARELDPSLL